MSRETRIICDVCKENEGKAIGVKGPGYTDGAGDWEHHYLTLDICPECAVAALRFILNNHMDQEGLLNMVLGKDNWTWGG